MVSLGSFIFFTSLSGMAFTVCSTLFLAGMGSLSHAGIWAVADYFSTILEVPYRSLQSSSTPLVSEYWRAKNKVGLLSIYKKSCINLLVAGMGFGGLILVNLNNIYRYFGPDYSIVLVPLVILVISRWINLGTGLNALIIQLSTHWRFDFFSTLIYSLIGIPLNFFLIKKYDMTGAAVANLTAMLLYNSVRFTFIWKKFGLQPLGWKNIGLLFFGSALIALVYAIPSLENLYIDGILRSLLFALLFGTLVIKGKFSDEHIQMWVKWLNKIPFIAAKN